MEVPLGFEIIDNVIQNTEIIIKWMEEQDGWEQSKIQINDKKIISNNRTSNSLPVPILSFNNPYYIYDMNKIVWNYIDNYAKIS